MRGISAHSNGFQTCRALHLLQMLLGSVDGPGGFRYKAPYPKPCPPAAAVRPARGDHARQAAARLAAGLSAWPGRSAVDAEARRCASTRRSLGFAAGGPRHDADGDRQRRRGDPYPIEMLLLFMANMAWNSAMNPGETHARCWPTRTRPPATTESRTSSTCDAYHSETVAYADLVLPDTTYLERWDCISLLDRPIGDAHGLATRSASPSWHPTATCARSRRC